MDAFILLSASTQKEEQVFCLIDTQSMKIVPNPLKKLGHATKWCHPTESQLIEPRELRIPCPQAANGVLYMRRVPKALYLIGLKTWAWEFSEVTNLFLDSWISIFRDQDTTNRFLESDIPVRPAPPVLSLTPPAPPTPRKPLARQFSIPAHVFRGFVENAIQKKETCPILLEPLTLATAAGLPCGHLFDRESITHALEQSGCCPQCRRETTTEEVQTL
jgi:hypothetical protein